MLHDDLPPASPASPHIASLGPRATPPNSLPVNSTLPPSPASPSLASTLAGNPFVRGASPHLAAASRPAAAALSIPAITWQNVSSITAEFPMVTAPESSPAAVEQLPKPLLRGANAEVFLALLTRIKAMASSVIAANVTSLSSPSPVAPLAINSTPLLTNDTAFPNTTAFPATNVEFPNLADANLMLLLGGVVARAHALHAFSSSPNMQADML